MLRLIILLSVVGQITFAQEISFNSPYYPTRIEWLTLQLNVNLSKLVDKYKPECFLINEVTDTVRCIGFLNSDKRNKEIKEIIKNDFDKLCDKLKIKNKIKIEL